MSPKFIRTSVRKSESLGEKLSKKRVSLGYEIKDIERAIRVRSGYINYIENSEWEKLPPDVFVRGFLKSYANFLKISPEKVIAIYLKERNLKENVAKVAQKKESPKRKKLRQKPIITPKKITIFSVLVIGVAVFGYIGWQLSILTAAPNLEISTPKENTKTESEKIVVEGKTDAGARILINNFEVGVSPDGIFKEEISLQDGVNVVQIKAISRLERETVTTKTVVLEQRAVEEITTEDTEATSQ